MFGLLLLLLSLHRSLSSDSKPNKTLQDCLKDADYNHLMHIAENGLNKTKEPLTVGIVGAGMAGLTAAKLLQDAGHEVIIYKVVTDILSFPQPLIYSASLVIF